jgi:hypothetical protein
MKKIAIFLIAITSLLSGWVADEVPRSDGGGRHADRGRDDGSDRMDRDRERERDRDGASNRDERR